MRLSTLYCCLPLLIAIPAHSTCAETGHWAFQPCRRVSVPTIENATGAFTDIDRFVLARIQAAGLELAQQAAPEVLLRRVTFDLVGRPPTIAEIDDWLASPTRENWRKIVDHLIASPEFGERWGQHWLDVARFAESSGGGRSLMFPEAWRYRDYVIDAINDDLPYDRFIVQQLAGDQLPHENLQQHDQHVVATGFLTLGANNYELQNKKLLEMEIVDEQIDTIGRAFLGLTLGCARCHDHKFDPISTEEYYGMAGIFTSTRSVVHENVGRPMTVPLKNAPGLDKYKQHQQNIRKNEQQLAELSKSSPSGNNKAEKLLRKQKIKKLQQTIKKLKAEPTKQPVTMAVADAEQPADTHVRYGGDVDLLGPLAPRRFIAAAGLPDSMVDENRLPRIAAGKSGRLELARWIASPENRLTSRVIVNRVWHHLLGVGIVATTDDFGVTGQSPTHPELLDYLATSFVQQGWSIKSLVRRIVLSRTYALSSDASLETITADPENKLLTRGRRRQLDAEAIRNALLRISRQHDPARGGRTITKLATYDTNYQFVSRRSSVYIPRFRNAQPDVLSAFGGANPNTVNGCRAPSILPTQALFLMNGPLAIESATHTARHLLEQSTDQQTRVESLYRLTLARPPTTAEVALAIRYLATMHDHLEGDSHAAELELWSGFCQLLLGSLDFRYLN